MSVCGIHCTVTILAWVGVATAKGDYRYRPPSFLFGAQQRAMLLACLSGALTWVSCAPVFGICRRIAAAASRAIRQTMAMSKGSSDVGPPF